MKLIRFKKGHPVPQQPAPKQASTAPDGGPLWSSREEAYEAGFRPRKIPRSRRRYDPNVPKLRGPEIQAEYDRARNEREAEQARRQAQYQAELERDRAERAAGFEPTLDPPESSWRDVLGDF